MFIFDSHAHIIPPIAGISGYSSVEEHLAVCQRSMHEHLAQPTRRVIDNRIVEKRLWNPEDPSPAGRLETRFHVGSHGRFVWEQEDVEVYIQYLPPYAERMEIPPAMMKAMMDYAGVQAAVLQCGNVYGKLNGYYRQFMQDNPWAKGVFYPLARIDEKKATTQAVMDELDALCSDGLLKGLWFAGDADQFTSAYDAFWYKVREMDLPVFILFYPDKNWVHTFRDMGRWVMKHGDVKGVLAQAFPLSARVQDDFLEIPDYTKGVIKDSSLTIEVVYPIGRGTVEEYPFHTSLEAVRLLYETFGARKLVWGSDMPMVERYCTYAQSLQYLLKSEIGISESDMELIVGKNLKAIFEKRD
jgi:predicted TIM-barrel fold metal-dependent hydrolase